jgi:hypothetical protein
MLYLIPQMDLPSASFNGRSLPLVTCTLSALGSVGSKLPGESELWRRRRRGSQAGLTR